MIKIYYLQKTTLQDFPNKIACIVFLSGCNFSCGFCHNPAAAKGIAKDDKETISETDFFDFLDKRKGKIDGVVVSGGEPTIFGNELIAFLQKIKARDFLVKLDTNGSNPKLLQEIYKRHLVDYVAMDIKSPYEKYKKMTNVKNIVEKIERSIKIIMTGKVDYEFRTTAYPGLNVDDFKKMFSYVKGCKKYVIQQYVPDVTLASQKPLVIYGKEMLQKIKNEIIKDVKEKGDVEEKEGVIYIR